ncbi:hypothetical protein F7725_015145 [Dissostichus mawsoni]|uniref:Prune homolog 2 with BCH domain n=1 Tax=Dissostichus mawsoni TaxID=36200 RepID=A0A7J5YK27_DISMA|nr:hypothetical protein F7725_015145 [Dissostichus mawsoni]
MGLKRERDIQLKRQRLFLWKESLIPPTSLPLQGGPSQRKKLSAPRISLSLDQSEDDLGETPDDLDINVDDLDTPDEGDYTDHEMDWEASRTGPSEPSYSIPTYSAEEERQDGKLWRTVVIGEQEHRINMKVIEPYMRVISHGGYYSNGVNAIIVFAACFLPDSDREEYHEIMENLFLYVISTLELMVAEDYMIVLKKNLKSFIILHPSTKFSSKIKYVNSLDELQETIPMDSIQIPECIITVDKELKEAAENSKRNSFLMGLESTTTTTTKTTTAAAGGGRGRTEPGAAGASSS